MNGNTSDQARDLGVARHLASLVSAHLTIESMHVRAAVFTAIGLAPFALLWSTSVVAFMLGSLWAVFYVFTVGRATALFARIVFDAYLAWRGQSLRVVPVLEALAKRTDVKDTPWIGRVIDVTYWMNPLAMTAILAMVYIGAKAKQFRVPGKYLEVTARG